MSEKIPDLDPKVKEMLEEVHKPRTPLGIKVIAIISLIAGLIDIVPVIIVVSGIMKLPYTINVILPLTYGVVAVISAIGILKLYKWAWFVSVGLNIVGLFKPSFFTGTYDIPGIAFSVIIISYLVSKRGLFLKSVE